MTRCDFQPFVGAFNLMDSGLGLIDNRDDIAVLVRRT